MARGSSGKAWKTTAKMNRPWMREQLEAYAGLCEEAELSRQQRRQAGIAFMMADAEASIRDRVVMAEPTIAEILARMDLALRADWDRLLRPALVADYGSRRALAIRAIGVLDSQVAAEEHLRPDGPMLLAEQLHPWVWGAAWPLWQAGARGLAVEQSAKTLVARAQQKTGLYSQTDRELMEGLWSERPATKEQPRLRLPRGPNTKTWESQQEGARSLSRACFTGMRNVASHHLDPGWSEAEALEYLACLSVLARWVDEAEVERVGELPGLAEQP